MRTEVKTVEMLEFLQEQFTYAKGLCDDFGHEDERARMHIGWCIGMKEMIEALIGAPVNLRRDGKVTIGL